MYNEEYENEQETKTKESFLANFYYNNKVLIWILIGVIAFILIMSLLTKGGSSSSSGGGYDVSIISRDENVVISIGHTYPLKAQVKNNSSAKVTWSSDNDAIASVDSDSGTVTAVGYGKAKIYATYIHTDGTKYTSNPPKEVTVADGNSSIVLTDVSFQSGSLLMPINSTYQIRLSLTPSSGYVTNKVFTSSNTSVATVDVNGIVTSVGEGETTITLDVNNGAIKKELKVFVSKDYSRSEIIVTPDTISFDAELIKMKPKTSEKMKYTISPTNANVSRLVWSSNNEEVATVDQNGIVKALTAGHATITLKSITGVSDTVDIEVEESVVAVTDISLASTSLYLTVGSNETIIPTVSPADASNKSLTYISGNSSIAAVAPNQTGTSATIYALGAGTTTITVISNNNIEKRITVTVAASSSGSGSSSSGSGSSSGGGSSSTQSQGFTISSKDANWATNHEGFIVGSEARTVNNAATAPVDITVTKTSSSIATIKVKACLTSAGSCDPSSSPNLTLNSSKTSGSFRLYSGTYKIAVGKYNSSGSLIGTTYKYIAIGGGSSNQANNNPTNNTGAKQMSSLTYTCVIATGELVVRDGTTTLGSSAYTCTKTVRSSDSRYVYDCTGKGNYTGSVSYSCPIPSGNSAPSVVTNCKLTVKGDNGIKRIQVNGRKTEKATGSPSTTIDVKINDNVTISAGVRDTSVYKFTGWYSAGSLISTNPDKTYKVLSCNQTLVAQTKNK